MFWNLLENLEQLARLVVGSHPFTFFAGRNEASSIHATIGVILD
jgi:hypothetical protein